MPALAGTFISKDQLAMLDADANQDDDPFFACDRSHERTDICFMRGDVRVDAASDTVLLFSNEQRNDRYCTILKEERIRPYTRKWETSVMQTVDEVSMQKLSYCPSRSSNFNSSHGVNGTVHADKPSFSCDVKRDVPAVVFSTGGFTGNVYHEFNDGLIPLFMTAHRFKGEVVFMILEYHDWWISKYGEIVRQLSNYDVVDFSQIDGRVHCFPEIVVGLIMHAELSIDASKLAGLSMLDFQQLLHRAYWPRLQERLNMAPPPEALSQKPKLVLVSRESPRALLNQDQVVNLAEAIGFWVEVIKPKPTSQMVDIYATLQSSDVMMGVHGAAMTHLLFVRPGCTFLQVVPLGTDWAAWTYYGEPARKLGLHYVEYKISPEESSLWGRYPASHPVLSDPDSINQKGWLETKRIYLDGQDLRLSLLRLRQTLLSVYSRAVFRRTFHR